MSTKADQPCIELWVLEEGGEDYVPFEIAAGSRHRAAVQRRYADELGLEFAEVRCRRAYIKIATWQEAWERSSDREYQIELRCEDEGVGDVDIVDDYGTQHIVSNVHPFYGYALSDDELDEQFGQMPEDWNPEFIYGAYSICEAAAEGAIPVWICTTW